MNYTNGKVICKLGTLQPFWCNDITTKHSTFQKGDESLWKIIPDSVPKMQQQPFLLPLSIMKTRIKEGLSQILCKHRRVVENRVHIFGRQRRRPLPPCLQRWRGRISRAASRLLTSGTVGVIPAYGLQYRRRSYKAGRFLFSMD